MASRSKRLLYKPAESATRNPTHKPPIREPEKRKLVQGRLVVSSGTALPLDNSTKKSQTPAPNAPRQQLAQQRDALLDLSDSDSSHGQRDQGDGVLVIDASHPTDDSHPTEVDIISGYERSPARVICHNAASAERRLRSETSGYVTHNVSVGGVPKVAVDQPPQQTQPAKTIHAEKFPSSSANNVSVISPLRGSRHKSHDSLPQPNFSDDSSSQLPGNSQSKFSICSDTSSQPDIIDVKASDLSSRPKKDKKKVKVVQSRHMQAAKVHGQTEKRAPSAISGVRTHASTKIAPKKAISTTDRTGDSQSRSVVSGASKVRGEPGERECKTSTPTQDLHFFETFDASAIVDDNGASFVKPRMTRDEPEIPVNLSQMSFVNNVSAIHDIVKPKAMKNALQGKAITTKKDITQEDIDLHYARYLQWLFLDSSARKSFDNQQKTAMAQLTGLHERVEHLRDKKAQLETELINVTHGNKLDQHLDIQRNGLGPIVVKASQFGHDHGILATAVDATRHEITTTGIHLGNDEALLQDGLVHALRESELLLGNMTTAMQDNATTRELFADRFSSLAETCAAERREVKKVEELVSAAAALTFEECSLKIQALQTG